ncbi:MAG TPA: FAD-dependent oxidoreductase [Actinomycetota bacterium]|nr:FAD-dependent oxidoreductase [Actinomycetota bacterium]
MAVKQTFVIVGAGLAGAKAAQTLRDEGFDGRVVMIGSETNPPYNRPPLSKGYLRGERTRASILVHDDAFYADHDIELLLATRVTGIFPREGQVETDASKHRIDYDSLLLATGSRPRKLAVPGSDLDGIHYLRTLGDSDRLRHELKSASRLAVVGAGWIGSEVAASAREMGVDVVLLDPNGNPLERIMGPQVGAVLRRLHAAHGVEFRPSSRVRSFLGDGAVDGIRTASGEIIPADRVVVGVGVIPRTELAIEAGLLMENGVATDDQLRTSAPRIYAAGDVANAWHPLFRLRLRVEHWATARDGGILAAQNMLGQGRSYDRIPHFLSTQYDFNIEYAGHASRWDQVVFRGEPASSGGFLAFWLLGGRVVAGMSANVPNVHHDIEHLVRSGRQVSPDMLADSEVPLDAVADEASRLQRL